MDFELSEEHKLIRNTARTIAKEKIAPRAEAIDTTGEYPEDIFQVFKEVGFLGLQIPTEYGGEGAGHVGFTLAVEEVAKVCHASAMMLCLSHLGTEALLLGGSEEQKQRYVPRVASGELRGAFALTDPSGGSDVAAMETKAEKKGGHYVINGEKVFISGAGVSDYYLVFAKTDPAGGSRGISAFVVPKDAPGFSVSRLFHKMGLRGFPLGALSFMDCTVPASNLIGKENDGFRLAMLCVNHQRNGPAARALGLAQGALAYALDYCRQRKAFGKPLVEHEALQFKLADMAVDIEAARLLVYQAAWLQDQKKTAREYAAYFSIAKAFASEMAVRVSSEALQLLGGHGYVTDHPMERYYRDARHLTMVEGTSEVQRLIISRALISSDIVY